MNISLPSKWSDIKIIDFIKIQQIIKDKSFEEEYDDAVLCEFERMIHLIAAISDKDISEIKQLDLKSLGEIRKAIDFIFHPELIEKRLPQYFIHHKKYYKVISDVRKLSAGEYIDLSTFTKDGSDNKLHEVMALFCYPCNWLGQRKKKPENFSEILLDLPITICYPVAVFFYQNYNNSLEAIQNYLMKQMEKQIQELTAEATQHIGDG
jgi:hypothetical protein